jgi:hypothetical protein
MTNEFKPIKANDNDIISFNDDHIYKFSKLNKVLNLALNQKVANQIMYEMRNRHVKIFQDNQQFINNSLFTEGIDCEIMTTEKKGWIKGKCRLNVTLEFCEDEPEIKEYESPLDEFRLVGERDHV